MPQNEAPLSRAKVKALCATGCAAGRKIDGPPNPTSAVVIPEFYTTAPAVSSVTISSDWKRAAAPAQRSGPVQCGRRHRAGNGWPTDFD